MKTDEADFDMYLNKLLAEFKLHLILTDDVIQVANRIYVKASVSLCKEDGSVVASADGWAREIDSNE